MKLSSSITGKDFSLSNLFDQMGKLRWFFLLTGVVLMALLMAYSTTSVVNAYLAELNFRQRTDSFLIQINSPRGDAAGERVPSSWKDFLAGNPFELVVRNSEEITVVQEQDLSGDFDIRRAQLVATFPGIALGLRQQEDMVVLLLGQEYRGYRILSIETDGAIFEKDGEEYMVSLVYSNSDRTNPPTARPTSQEAPSAGNGNRLVQAPSDSEPGSISQELVNRLLLNPFDEMKKIRLRAKFNGDEALGIQVQWLARESIFGELGVEKGDVIRSVNGIPIQNMGDISNAINSLMGGKRFEVEVLRDGESRELSYVVR